MRTLDYIQKYYVFFTFLLLEIIALSLTAGRQSRPKAFFINSSNFFVSNIYSANLKLKEYLYLRKENKDLLKENLELKRNCSKTKFQQGNAQNSQYLWDNAMVIKNSISAKNNFITINKGRKDGIKKNMSVVSADGAVGIIVNVSAHYSIALSLLNQVSGISCKMKNINYYGSAIWDGKNYRQVILSGIPNHINVRKGDTVVTSGYSAYFPQGITVGTVDTFWRNVQDNFYTIRLNLSVDMKKLTDVYIIKNKLAEEQIELEKNTQEIFR